MARIEAIVAPGSREFAASYDALGKLRVRLTERAEGNRANRELVRKLSKLLDAPVMIVWGAASKRKILEVGLDGEEAAKRIRAFGEG